MKRIICLALAMIFTCVLLEAQLHPDYENPKVFERNQELAHATLMPYPSSETALQGERNTSPFHLSLNGPWQFHWAENPEEAPEEV